MARTELTARLDEIRTLRNEVRALLEDIPDTDTDMETPGLRSWRNLGVVLLRFGDHMREHANQIAGARQELGSMPSDVQRKLAEAERAWGQLLGTLVGLDDEDLDRRPASGAWTIRETLDHILASETHYLEAVRAGYRQRGTS